MASKDNTDYEYFLRYDNKKFTELFVDLFNLNKEPKKHYNFMLSFLQASSLIDPKERRILRFQINSIFDSLEDTIFEDLADLEDYLLISEQE